MSLFVAGAAVGGLFLAAVWLTGTTIYDGEALVLTRGEHVSAIVSPGWHWVPQRWLPGIHARRVSLRFASRFVTGVWEAGEGTTVAYQVWLELRVVRPEVAVAPGFESALRQLVAAAVGQVVERERAWPPHDHRRLNLELREALQAPATAAGLEISSALLNLSPASSAQPRRSFARVV
jgi:regulator of protease activity HflC (stomatin/prohibitin superfamily)